MPLIVFVSLSNVTPVGKPLTLLVTGWPLLSDASILIVSIDVLTSFVWFAIALTVGAISSTTLIVNFVSVSYTHLRAHET